MTDTPARPTPVFVRLLIGAFSLCTAALLVQKIITKGLNHDEHQFVVPSVLLLRDGLWPYVHYPHFHMPNLVFANALPLLLSDHALLGARLLTALLGWVLLMLIFHATWRAFAPSGPWHRALAAIAIVTLTVANSTYLYTAGPAWNHQHAALPAVAAFLLLAHAGRQARSAAAWVFIAGLLLALGIGVRLSVAPLGLPLLLMIVHAPMRREQRTGRLVLAYFLGLAVGMLPSLALALASPADFWFGNFIYPALNRAYWLEADTVYFNAITLTEKIKQVYYLIVLRPMDMPWVLICIGALAACGAWRWRSRARYAFEARAAVLCGAFALIGAFAPTPFRQQYFFGVVPFVSLAAMYALASCCTGDRPRRWPIAAAGLAAVCAVALGGPQFAMPDTAFEPARWPTTRIHRVSFAIAEHVPAGRVVTLAPIFIVEGRHNLTIDPRLNAGPFAWRTAGLLDADQRVAHKMLGPDDFAAQYSSAPPAGILVGLEGDLAEPLTHFARSHHYTPHPLPGDLTLWVRRP